MIILSVALLAHGLLFISDFRIWDDWLMEEIVLAKRWEDLQRVYNWNGMPIFAYFIKLFMFFENPNYAAKIFSFVCITSMAILVFYIFYKTSFVSKTESLFIALVSLTFPAYRVFGGINYSILLLSYLTFLGAVFIAFLAEEKRGWKHVSLRSIALAGFFFSFFTGSLLVFYGGFFLALVLFEHAKSGRRSFDILWKQIFKHIDYLCLPFVYWTLFKLFWPPKFDLIGHYNLSFSVHKLLSAYVSLIRSVMLPSIKEGITFLFLYPILLILVVIACYAITRYFCVSSQSLSPPKASTSGLFAFGLTLLVLGTLPYILTRDGFSTYGVGTRLSLLTNLPVAILLIAALRFLCHHSNHPRWIFMVFLFVLSCFSVINVKTYVSWQAESVKEHSFQFNLSEMRDVSAYSVIEICDEFIIPETNRYPFFVWTLQLRHVTSNPRLLAFPRESMETIHASSKCGSSYEQQELRNIVMGPGDSFYHLFNEIDYAGKQCLLTIRLGQFFQERVPTIIENREFLRYTIDTKLQVELVVGYYYHKYLRPEKMNDFLRGITSLDIHPLS